MKRPIKFRGRHIATGGKMVYGDFVHVVPMSSFPGIVDEYDKVHAVDPDSVAQLVGYDRNGDEVYEGDTVILPTGEEYEACLSGNIEDGEYARIKEPVK